jgi:hypothetical protein
MGGTFTFIAMRWLMIGLLVSLGALLLAAAGGARHIWLQHAKLRREQFAGTGKGSRTLAPAHDSAEQTNVETKI